MECRNFFCFSQQSFCARCNLFQTALLAFEKSSRTSVHALWSAFTMIRNAVLSKVSLYYPFGNTPAVCLTQDLPPEQDADILLLGCGDARNILFTCYADAARKIDVTCCDIEPGIHARNVLLYTLLIEDQTNENIELIWNIYYHWKIDKKSQELLETQIHKLLQVSESMDQWHDSAYGSCIRFCDSRSLSRIRSYWMGFQFQGLTLSEKVHRRNQLETAINKAKAYRETMPTNVLDMAGLRATCPASDDSTAVTDMSQVSKQWWDSGTTTPSSRTPAPEAIELNPALLYSPNKALTLQHTLSPLHGFPLSTAYTPTIEGSIFCMKREVASSAESLVDAAKSHFSLWAKSFREAVAKKSVIRIVSGDALAFGLTLRSRQITKPVYSRSANKVSDNLLTGIFADSLMTLDHSDYDKDKNVAPLVFNIIDTSNLVDHLGPLNLFPIGSSLLKQNASSCLYSETLVSHHSNLVDRLVGFFGVDTRTMSFLLGLIPVDLFTNATNTCEDNSMINEVSKSIKGVKQQATLTQVRSRLRWRRLLGCEESSKHPHFRVDAKALSNFLVLVYDGMFKHEDEASVRKSLYINDPSELGELAKLANPHYNRASFALLLNFIRGNIVTNWDECVEHLYSSIYSRSPPSYINLQYAQEHFLNMHLYGVDNGRFRKPNPGFLRHTILAPHLPPGVATLDHLSVTIRISRKELNVFTSNNLDQIGTPTLYCGFESGDPSENGWSNYFSAVRIAFGTWCEQSGDKGSLPYIIEDDSQLSGTSDLFVSVLVPTWIIVRPERSAPCIFCGIIPNAANAMFLFPKLGPDLRFASRKMTSEDVFITKFIPGMSGLPVVTLASSRDDELRTTPTTMKLLHDGSKVAALVRRITIVSEVTKSKLAIKSSSVKVEFKSPLMAIVRIAETHELEIEFPVPVSPSNYKLKIARQSSYIEIETLLYDPPEKDGATFIFPIVLTRVPSGETIPTPLTFTRIDMNSLPTIDLGNMQAISWFHDHVSSMFSKREASTRKNSQVDIRTQLKNGLFSIFMHYTGLQIPKSSFFELRTGVSEYRTLIFPTSLRLDLVNHTVVLDCVIIPLTNDLSREPRVDQFLSGLSKCDIVRIDVSPSENQAWKALIPAFVERCRAANSWKHASSCKYLQAGKTPQLIGLCGDPEESPICSCGVGKFPFSDHLKRSMIPPDLEYIMKQYGTRAAISPIFAVPHVEDCSSVKENEINIGGVSPKLTPEKCANCGARKRENLKVGEQRLMVCSRCKKAKYCSVECQKANWKKHKQFCSAV